MRALILGIALLAIALTGCAANDTLAVVPSAAQATAEEAAPPGDAGTIAETGGDAMKETSPREGSGAAMSDPTGSPAATRSAVAGAPADLMPEVTALPAQPEHEIMPRPIMTPAGVGEAAMKRSDADGTMPAAPAPEHSGSRPPGHLPDRPRHQPALKAGEVDDNARWQEYLRFVRDYAGRPVHETDLSNRQIVTVLDRNGNPVPNATVTLMRDGEKIPAQFTYADGRTLLFPGDSRPDGMVLKKGQQDSRYMLRVSRDSFVRELELDARADGAHEVRLGGMMDYGNRVDLDVLFLLDSTGSMADEIRQIKRTLGRIARRVSELPSSPDLRFAMVSYRDRGDDYVTRLYDFESSVKRFRRSIQGVRADGGDDYPESLNQAFHEAVNDANWRRDSIRLIFLVADAPPHLDYPQDEDYAVEMVRARQRGIKVFSVASSGLDEQGEYIFRQIAQQTMGRFLFILYGSGSQGSLETPHDVEQYSVDRLDDLIVGLIEDELSALGQQGDQGGMSMK